MYLFKVWNQNRSKKVMITIAEKEDIYRNIILKASEKLGIDGVSIVFECDGTSIDEDEAFLMLKDQVFLLLGEGESWCDPNETSNSETTSAATTITLSESSESNLQLTSNQMINDALITLPIIQLDHNMEYLWTNFEIPWQKLTTNILEMCESGIRNKQVITQIVHVVVNEMLELKKNPPTKAIKIVANKMVQKYPNMFKDVDEDGVVLGDGACSIFTKLHERVHYLNRPHKRPLKEFVTVSNKRIKNAVAGCSNWNPSEEPSEELAEDPTEIKKCLLSIEDPTYDEEYTSMLDKTYKLQRDFINSTNLSSIDVIMSEWPFLLKLPVIRWHFKKVTNVELTSLSKILTEKSEKIIRFGTQHSIKVNDCSDKVLQSMYILSVYFKENFSKMFLRSQTIETGNDAESHISILAPCILEIGGTVYKVFFEKRDVFTATNFTEAMEYTMGLYFVLNLKYIKEASCILEFIQRYMLKIHPDAGTKSSKINTSKRKVITLMNKLRDI